MTSEKFAKLLKDPLGLDEVTLNEIETLKSKYPFSKNIQLLYLRKCKLLGLTQNKKEIQRIAYQQKHPIMFSNFIDFQSEKENHESIDALYQDIFASMQNDNAEEKAQETTIKKEKDQHETTGSEDTKIVDLEIVTSTINPIKTSDITDDAINKEQEDYDILDELHSEKIELTEKKKTISEIKEIKNTQFEEAAEKATPKKDDISYIKLKKSKTLSKKHFDKKRKKKAKIKAIALKKKKKKNLKPFKETKKAKDNTYVDWLDGLKSTAEVLKEEIRSSRDEVSSKKEGKKKSKKKKKKGNKLQSKINKSLVRNDKIYTETLAELLVKQGHNKKAIEIYKQLMQNNPEKSDYFAGLINKLK